MELSLVRGIVPWTVFGLTAIAAIILVIGLALSKSNKRGRLHPLIVSLIAAVLAGAMTRGDSLESAVRLASDFVSAAMRNTMECQTPPNLGVQLEKTLEMLIPKGGQS